MFISQTCFWLYCYSVTTCRVAIKEQQQIELSMKQKTHFIMRPNAPPPHRGGGGVASMRSGMYFSWDILPALDCARNVSLPMGVTVYNSYIIQWYHYNTIYDYLRAGNTNYFTLKYTERDKYTISS